MFKRIFKRRKKRPKEINKNLRSEMVREVSAHVEQPFRATEDKKIEEELRESIARSHMLINKLSRAKKFVVIRENSYKKNLDVRSRLIKHTSSRRIMGQLSESEERDFKIDVEEQELDRGSLGRVSELHVSVDENIATLQRKIREDEFKLRKHLESLQYYDDSWAEILPSQRRYSKLSAIDDYDSSDSEADDFADFTGAWSHVRC